jgi:hypothetical protein
MATTSSLRAIVPRSCVRPHRSRPASASWWILSHSIRAADGASLRAAGYSFQYWTAAAPNSGPFQLDGVLHVRTTPGERTRSYGGVATDFNNDGWLE